jgi:hypothetical protein
VIAGRRGRMAEANGDAILHLIKYIKNVQKGTAFAVVVTNGNAAYITYYNIYSSSLYTLEYNPTSGSGGRDTGFHHLI